MHTLAEGVPWPVDLSTAASTADPSVTTVATGHGDGRAHDAPTTEAELFERVVELAEHHRWAIHYGRPSSTSRSWRASTTGHVGFPDLVLARGGVVLIRKLRSERGRLTPEQRDWGAQLGDLWAVWRPSHWREIVAELTVAAHR